MDYDKAVLWIEALLSGEYEQGTGYLQDNGKYCCLAVLCEVAKNNGLDIEIKIASDGIGAYDGEISVLPPLVRDWAGMVSDIGEYEYGDGNSFNYLSEDNDRHGLTFSQIADIIRWQAEYL